MSSSEPTIIRYRKPEPISATKTVVRLVRDEHMLVNVQVITEGGENNLHSHRNLDGLWFILAGTARFYTTDDELLGEFGPGDGVFIPRDYPYWFESSGEQPLEILQAEAIDRSMALGETDGRVDHRLKKASFDSAQVL